MSHVPTRGGEHRWLETVLVNLLDDPDVAGILANSRDITARRAAEEALAQANADLTRRVHEATAELVRSNAALSRAGRAKDEFLAAMSHELRTPLNAVLGLTEALGEEIYGPVAPRQRAALERITQSGEHLLALLSDIMDLAEIEAGKQSLALESLHLGDVCRQSLAAIERAAHQKRLSRSHGGTGLGLSLARRLVNLHGGTLSVESEPDRGSRFTVLLPAPGVAAAATREKERPAGRRVASSAPEDRAAEDGAAGATEDRVAGAAEDRAAGAAEGAWRILIADDDEINVGMLVDYLRSRGHVVLVARDGRRAVELAREGHPDVILMDIQMPILDGLAAIRELQGDPARPAPSIIALTALAMPGDRERCLAAGATLHMTKPVSLRRMGKTLQGLLGARRPG